MVTIYGQAKCSFCAKAVELCEELEIPFVYKDISFYDNRAAFKKNFPDATTVPQITIGDVNVGGYADLVQAVAGKGR